MTSAVWINSSLGNGSRLNSKYVHGHCEENPQQEPGAGAEAMKYGYPRNPYRSGTQLCKVYERLILGEVSGEEFLKMYIPEYRSRLNEIEKELLEPNGLMLKRSRVEGSKFVQFSII